MKIDLDLKDQGVDVSTSGYRDFVNAEVRGVELEDVLEDIKSDVLFSAIDLSDYIDWADNNSKLPEILDRLSPDEVISWLHENGHLEDNDD
ncbi:hypothetical protein ACR9T2_002444 [Salmonella enterica subsp. enterica serovar Montevideo]|uniref:Uncharacterized protein n=1 Tax=Salmonella montevideo TaxID=115981 RepID=A0A5Q7EAH7_SALMO|nr:hypothetical protein [Salmonella enterica]EBP4096462.1 hypothetical protein [Salmonella enterica subsp. enterica]EIA1760729.1 hypothetical protein [Salmonella enterica subsp. enterica serovar Lubbock]MDI5816033.1 hypothetical protein [Salmonella enterica subsp. enterica serovar Cerro]AJQ73511.1 hypothetical protein AW67_16020 [Salmonella enterica subsp. enterica serovar Montevideo str. USDA-ARS-USMARC-1903]EAB0096354.1 hypothetical protein [Salmonella enterica subsp. enterica serovar Montev